MPGGVSFDGTFGAEPVVFRGVSTRTAQTVAAAAIVPMVALTLALGFTGSNLQRPVLSAVYWGYLVASSMAIGVYWWWRRPASRFGPLLIAFGVLVWLVSWQNASAPLAFDIAILAEGPTFAITFYLFLSFPMGRIEPPAARWLMAILVFAVVGFFLPWALFSPVIAGGGPLSSCAAECPENVLQIATAPDVVRIAGEAETYAALGVTAAVLFVYAWRVRTASRPQRRALLAVAATSLLFMPAYLVFNVARQILELDPETLYDLSWGIIATRILMPLGFLIALLQADRFAGMALRTMLEELATRPTPQRWRDTVAEALDDPPLQIGYLDPNTGSLLEPDGEVLEEAPPGRAWVPVDPVAAMVVDEALAEDPELVRAAATATLVAVENGALEGEVRRQIQRDIHDSAQQRLLALRIHLALAGEQTDRSQDREMLERLDSELEQAIEELRGVTRRGAPRDGLAPALQQAASAMPLPVTVRSDGVGRLPEALETTIYYCVLEGLQNAVKHAGRDAHVEIDVVRRNGTVTFTVADDGVGFDPAAATDGSGLENMADRLAAVGGTLEVDSRLGEGTRITGTAFIP
ncbi:MAG TPA: ATP-binding protein [Solirubrobacter sp.]|nr:ATP-binding protein [Solirubrobacter sp.]